ncbi:arylsulfatase A-like [Saccoglossus kowalevskii]|uniref:Arylsulfatase A-like n=1 Tax=Saccoglossus kowalevskii TaxID=10224 RepID=A0ABM0GX31_SACKO|nr:PREDICTED: arylsulfatase A-like [Saccoglossus kowalevskii]
MFFWRIQLFAVFVQYFIDKCKTAEPNIVILFADDVGYGDLGCYGHPTTSTPHLDKLAANGLLLTQFYAGSPVCSPSRASLLTGRLPPRTGVYPGVFQANDSGGLPLNETTIAELLKTVNYQTGMIGKWHLGVGENQKYLPTNFGFDYYFGIPYTHAQCPCVTCFWPRDSCYGSCKPYFPGCPLFYNDEIVDQPVDLLTLNEQYANAARDFIAKNAQEKKPFFLYYAFQHCHHPQFAGKKFRNSTSRGVFGDSLAEIDWSVGQVIKELKQQDIDKNTLVFFSSDNGPSIQWKTRGGVAGLLKCGKGTTYEGGQRVPGIAYWPGMIKPGRSMELASTLDLLPTIAKMVNGILPNVTLDGVDMGPILFTQDKGLRDTFFYYYPQSRQDKGVYAVRYHQYKAHYYTRGASESGVENKDKDCRPSAELTWHNPPLLFDLNQDPSELYNLNSLPEYNVLLNEIHQIYERHVTSMKWAESEINKYKDPKLEPCCKPGCKPFPSCCQCHKLGHSQSLTFK